jgi:hypothetical protein
VEKDVGDTKIMIADVDLLKRLQFVGWVEPLRNPPAGSPKMVGFAKGSTHPKDDPMGKSLRYPNCGLSSPRLKKIFLFFRNENQAI